MSATEVKEMQMKRNYRRFGRNANGNSGLSEMGPAIMVLLICFFFPLMDLLAVCLSYGFCRVLNYNQVHEASLIPWKKAVDVDGSVIKIIPDQWANGMGRFVKMSGDPATVITYRDGITTQDSGSNQVRARVVSVQTTVVCNPFLPIPLPSHMLKIPGLNGPMTFSIASERPMENPDYAP